MGRVYEGIDERLATWIARQPLFFVGTAPAGADGHVNVSPKGPIGTLRVLDQLTVAYLDMVGSGAETIAHLRENGRIVIMLCAFDGAAADRAPARRGRRSCCPTIRGLRARCSRPASTSREAPEAGARSSASASPVADSCGYGVPLMATRASARTATSRPPSACACTGPDAMIRYQEEYNRVSIDGLPAVHMITGVHAVLFSEDAEAVRAFLRDVLEFESVDAGGGWLIFALAAGRDRGPSGRGAAAATSCI